MRLLDRIITEGFRTNDPKLPDQQVMENLLAAQLVVIDNVAAYYFQEAERKRGEDNAISADDFPNVMLPFPFTFLDMRPPAADQLRERFPEVGILMRMIPKTDNVLSVFEADDIQWIGTNKQYFVSDETKHLLICTTFAYDHFEHQIHHVGNFSVPVGMDGRIVSSKETGVPWLSRVFLSPNKDETQERMVTLIRFYLERYVFPGLLGLSFMHCRNVRMTEERPPEKLSRKYQKRTGRPLLKYHILHIDHMKQVLEREGNVSTHGLKRALHICRGHFKHYGQDGKGLLFGKYTATIWTPMHTRGAKEEGVVVKDYDVK